MSRLSQGGKYGSVVPLALCVCVGTGFVATAFCNNDAVSRFSRCRAFFGLTGLYVVYCTVA